MSILVAGGAGYIGSHTCVELLNAGYDAVVADNLSNSKFEAIKRIEAITGKQLSFYNIDVRNAAALDRLFDENEIEAVINFSGYKAVGESVANPLMYYENNIDSMLSLCRAMKNHDVKKLVFSSSATVYGDPKTVPITEDMPTGNVTNPYGRTKFFIEGILSDLCKSDSSWSVSLLRYFNPVGAHPSGLIGEDPKGIPNNLMPYISQVASGKLPRLRVFGNDYNTHDGTGVRDYIHVCDLARGHICALKYISGKSGCFIHNLGTGIGYSVLDMVNAFERANDIKIDYEIVERRAGDIDVCYANPKKAFDELAWKAEKDITDMCRDSWNWQSHNPNGYADAF